MIRDDIKDGYAKDVCVKVTMTNNYFVSQDFSIISHKLDCRKRLAPKSIDTIEISNDYVSPKHGGKTISYSRSDFFDEV